MKKIYRLLLTITAITFFPPYLALGRALNEDAALHLLLHTLTRDHVYAKRISLDCVTFDTEETTKEYFQFLLRENHTDKCGGDPETSPVVDRYRVHRASGKIELYEAAKDTWRDYNPARIR
jgi:hypothetical protein